MLTLLFYSKDKPFEDQKPLEIRFKYFNPLEDALEKFNDIHDKNISKIYNRYGQEIPLTYRIQKTNFELFYWLNFLII